MGVIVSCQITVWCPNKPVRAGILLTINNALYEQASSQQSKKLFVSVAVSSDPADRVALVEMNMAQRFAFLACNLAGLVIVAQGHGQLTFPVPRPDVNGQTVSSGQREPV
jgi:hypothetical protein